MSAKINSLVLWSLCVIIISCCSANLSNSCKLVHAVFRHGDRNPTETYKNDPYINFPWPDGWGSLTKKGKGQLYELGSTLRDRYYQFFKANSSTNIIRVQSSDPDRCHMSAATFLAGLYPPTEDQIWNSKLNWQPIPIHSLPLYLDNIVAMKKKCPTYDQALLDAYKSKEIQIINKENEELYKYLSEFTGQDMYDITAVEFLYNTLEIEENNGLSLPEWTKNVYPDKMKKLAIRSLQIFTETTFMKKMKGGVFLKEMIQNIQAKKQGTLNPDRDMFIYSAHDITLINIMNTLGLANNLKPEYGAALAIEAHETNSSDFEIKMLYYKNFSSKEPEMLKINQCGEPCYLDDFVQGTKHLIPVDWEKECEIQ